MPKLFTYLRSVAKDKGEETFNRSSNSDLHHGTATQFFDGLLRHV